MTNIFNRLRKRAVLLYSLSGSSCLFLQLFHPLRISLILTTINLRVTLQDCIQSVIGQSVSWCVSKPSAKALIGFPFGKDRVVFNSHKIYGPVMLSHVFANWKLLHTNADWNKFSEECDWCYEPLFLLSRECDE